jgi:hypothetical protein
VATLPAADAALFIRLQVALLLYANQKLGIMPGVDSEEAFRASSLQDKAKLRDALHANPQVIDSFVAENPAGFAPEELALVAAWKRGVVGTFYIFRYLKRYTVFLDDKTPPQAYGVLGIPRNIEDLFMLAPPIMVKTVLLPWRDKIVCDGLVLAYNLYLGAGIRGTLNRIYQRIKATTGIVETLGGPAVGQPAPGRTQKRGPSVEEMLAALDRIEQEIAGLKTPALPAQRGAFGVVRAAVELARLAVHERADVDGLVGARRRLNNAVNRLYGALDLG